MYASIGASSSAGTKSSGCSGSGMYTGTLTSTPWNQVTYSGKRGACFSNCRQPPRKGPQMGILHERASE
ncbi:hypothetical protein Tco_0227585 [Tanacetum coccineum]